MKALIVRKFDTPPKLEEIEIPKPKKDEALVKVAYCGINRIDLRLLTGALRNISLPLIPGAEVVGMLSDGKRVAVNPYLHCGICRYCRSGEYLVCERGRPLLGIQKNGGFAEYIVVPKPNLVEIPKNISFSDAAAVTLSGGTAYHMVCKKALVKTHEWAIVTAAAGGVGIYACQFLRNKGVNVLALIGDDRKRRELKVLGIIHVVNYKKTNWIEDVSTIIQGSLLTAVFDSVGGKILESILPMISPLGIIVNCGATENSLITVNLVDMYMKQKTLVGSSGFANEDLKQVFDLVGKNKIKPVIDSIYPLEKIHEGWEKLRSRNVVGKILVKFAE